MRTHCVASGAVQMVPFTSGAAAAMTALLVVTSSLGAGPSGSATWPSAATQGAASAGRSADDGRFSVIVIPDSQLETYPSAGDRFANRTRWIVANRAALNLKFVLHTGDVVDSDNPTHSQYEVAAPAMRILNSGSIPWVPTVGNHDTAAVCGGPACDPPTTYLTVRDTTTFNRYFPVSGLPWVQGTFEPNKVDNTWSTFTAGDQQWLVLNLELWPRKQVVQWANGLVRSHPKHNVLVETHHYLNADGSIGQRVEYGATSPQYLHDNLIMPNSNIKLVFSGHVGSAGHREEVRPDGTKVVALLGTFHSRTNNPTQILTIDTAARTVSTRFYAPSNGQAWPQYAATFSNFTWAGSAPPPQQRRVALRSFTNKQLVTAENAGRLPLVANRTWIRPWEVFTVVDRGNGKVALQSNANNKYVCSDNHGQSPLIANRSTIGLWETYQLIKNSDGSVSLRAMSNGKYVTAERAGSLPLIANRTAIGPWERFYLIDA